MGSKEIRARLHMARVAVRRTVRKVLGTSPAKFDYVCKFVRDKRTRWTPDMIPLARHMYIWYQDKPIGRLGDVNPEGTIRGHVYLVGENGKFLAYVVSRSVFEDATWEDVQCAILDLKDPYEVAYVAHGYQDKHLFRFPRWDSYGYFVWKMPREETPAAWATRHLEAFAVKCANERRESEVREAEWKASEDAQHNALYDV